MNAFNPHDDPQFDNLPTQEFPGNIAEFAYNSHIGNREKFLPTLETRGAKQSLEKKYKKQEKLHQDTQLAKDAGKALEKPQLTNDF